MADLARKILLLAIVYPGLSPALEHDGWTLEGGFTGGTIEGDLYDSPAGDYPGFVCDLCRDPADHVIDFAAFAYNGVWGEDRWMDTTRLGTPFRVYNLDLDWVVVWFEDVLFDMPSLLPNTLDIRVRLATGEILTITVLQGGPDLPVGSLEADGADAVEACGCTGDGGGADGEDDPGLTEEAEWPEFDDSYGTVEIVDPDADGEFPPWEEEL